MKATGIVRRIDDLGRIVIPKEVRRRMRVREGDPMEIYVDAQGGIVLKKYHPVDELKALLHGYASAIQDTFGFDVAICNTDIIIAAAGPLSPKIVNQAIHEDLWSAIQTKSGTALCKDDIVKLTQDQPDTMIITSQIIVPITDEEYGMIGAIIMFTDAHSTNMGMEELKGVELIVNLIQSQVDFK